jgi:hypothetical protein
MASLEGMTPQQIEGLASVYTDLLQDASTRKDILRLTKKRLPNVSIPEIDMDDKVNSKMEELAKEREEFRKEQQMAKLEAERDKKRQKLLDKGLIEKEDEFDEVEKFMTEKGMGDHEAAAQFRKLERQAAIPTASRYVGPTMDLPPTFAEVMKNPQQWALNEAGRVMAEIKSAPKARV